MSLFVIFALLVGGAPGDRPWPGFHCLTPAHHRVVMCRNHAARPPFGPPITVPPRG